MAKKQKKVATISAGGRQQEDRLWTLARQVADPANFQKECAETSNLIRVPERLFISIRDSRTPVLAREPKRQNHRFVLAIVLKSAGQICLDERIFRLDAGHALLIFPFQFRHFISLQESSIRWIFISFDMVHADSLESLRNQPWHLTEESTQILHRLLEAASFRRATHMTRSAEAQLWLALFLSQNSAPGMGLPFAPPIVSTEAQKLLECIHAYLYRHIDQPFKLEDMARGIGCSKSHLYRQFKEYFKISLGHYVAKMRLKKAVHLLHEDSLNISGVAQACGYASVLHAFSRTFHAAMGCSPREYRMQINKRK